MHLLGTFVLSPPETSGIAQSPEPLRCSIMLHESMFNEMPTDVSCYGAPGVDRLLHFLNEIYDTLIYKSYFPMLMFKLLLDRAHFCYTGDVTRKNWSEDLLREILGELFTFCKLVGLKAIYLDKTSKDMDFVLNFASSLFSELDHASLPAKVGTLWSLDPRLCMLEGDGIHKASRTSMNTFRIHLRFRDFVNAKLAIGPVQLQIKIYAEGKFLAKAHYKKLENESHGDVIECSYCLKEFKIDKNVGDFRIHVKFCGVHLGASPVVATFSTSTSSFHFLDKLGRGMNI